MSAETFDSNADEVFSQRKLLQVLVTVRRRRRSHGLKAIKRSSSRRSLVVMALLVPGAILVFLALVVTMAINFGQASSSAHAEDLLSTLLLATFSTCLAGCLSTTLQSLYMNNEVRFLATLPVPFRLIFFAKFGDMARGAIPGIMFGLAVCSGFVLGRAQQYLFLVYALVAIALLAATAVFLAAGLTSLVVRLAPPSKTRSLLMFASLLILLATTLTWSQLDFTNQLGSGQGDEPNLWVSFLPSGWAREILVRLIGNEPLTALPFVGLQIGFLLLIAIFGATTFASTFARNLERVDLRAVSPRPRPAPRLARRILKLVPAQIMHWVKREWILIGRDFARYSAAVLPIASVSLWVISTLAWSDESGRRVDEHFWITHLPLLLLPWGISMGTTIFAFGSEPHGFELVRSLPVRPRTLMAGKYISYALPITGFCVLAGFVSIVVQPGSRQNSFLVLSLICLLSAVFCAVDIAFATSSPRFGAELVQRSTGFWTRIFSTLTGLLCALVIAAGVALSPIGRDGIGSLFGSETDRTSPLIWILTLLIGVCVPVLLMAKGTRRIGQLMSHG